MPVENFTAIENEMTDDDDTHNITLKWKYPCQTNGKIDKFVLTMKKGQKEDMKVEFDIPVVENQFDYFTVWPNVKPHEKYHYWLSADNGAIKGKSSFTTIFTSNKSKKVYETKILLITNFNQSSFKVPDMRGLNRITNFFEDIKSDQLKLRIPKRLLFTKPVEKVSFFILEPVSFLLNNCAIKL